MMKSRPVKIILAILAFWAVFVAVEGVRLIGSADPGKYPILTIYSTQTADEIADYHSLGFAQTYHLTVGMPSCTANSVYWASGCFAGKYNGK